MKKILILFFLLAFTIAKSQPQYLPKISVDSGNRTVVKPTYISLYFSENAQSIEELRLRVLSFISEHQYLNQWSNSFSIKKDLKFNHIDVKAKVNGKEIEYTFFEFYKLIWQNK
jgi:hypothetical protein